MERTKFKKALSLLIALAMCLSLFSVPVFADDEDGIEDLGEEVTLFENNAVYTLNPIFTEGENYSVKSNGWLTYFTRKEAADFTATPQSSKITIKLYDELGYPKWATYNVTYTNSDGEATTESAVAWSRMNAIITDSANTNVAITADNTTLSSSTGEKQYTVKTGASNFFDTYYYGLTGSAYDDMVAYSTTRGWGYRNSGANYFNEFTKTDGTTVTAAEQNAAFKTFVANPENYLYTVTPDTDGVMYVALPSIVTPSKLAYEKNGWTLIDSSSFSVNSVPAENFMPEFASAFDEDGNWILKNPLDGKAVAKSLYMVDASYNPENYPYYLSKVQYDGHDTVPGSYPYVYYKQVTAGEAVKIWSMGVNSDTNAPKVFMKYGQHVSDDVTGKLVSDSGEVNLTSREDTVVSVQAAKNGAVNVELNDLSSTAVFSETADFASTTESYTLPEGENEKTVYLKIAAPAGNDVVYTVNVKTDDNVNGTLTVGNQQIRLTDKKTKYYVSGAAAGEAVSFAADSSAANVTVGADSLARVPYLLKVDVTSAAGRTWNYEVVISSENMYQISDITMAAGAFASPVKVFPKGDYTTGDSAANAFDAAKREEIIARYGNVSDSDTEFYAGTDAYMGYPSMRSSAIVPGYYYIDSPKGVTETNTSPIIFNGEAYMFKHTKQRANNTDFYYGGEGKHDGTDGKYYLSFKINRPGTMYMFEVDENKGAPNFIKAGYEKVTGMKFANSTRAYAKHFDVTEGELTTVNVPSYGWDEAWGLDTSKRNFMNPAIFVFVFDTERDTSLESLTYSGAVSGSVNLSETKFDYSVDTYNSETGTVTITPVLKNKNASVEPAAVTAELVNGEGKAEFTVVSADQLAQTKYTLTFAEPEKNKVKDGTKVFGNEWIDGMYGSGTELTYKATAVEYVPAAGEKVVYMNDRGDTAIVGTHISEQFAGSTYIRLPKNEGASSFETVDVYRHDDENDKWVTDANATFTRQVGDNDPVTMSADTKGSSKGTFRKVINSQRTNEYFGGKYDGLNGNGYYMTFRVTGNCRVFIADRTGAGYPNLDKSKWTRVSYPKYVTDHMYVRDYKAGDLVEIPNYGLTDEFKDETPVVYTYYDSTGTKKTHTTTVASDTLYWDGIQIVIGWEAEAALSDLKVGGATVEGFAADKTEYTVNLETDEIPEITASAAHDNAVIDINKADAEGGIVKATVTVWNGVYSKDYVINFVLGNPEVEMSISALGGTVIEKVGDAAAENIGAGIVAKYPRGTNIELTAAPESDSYKFLYWRETTTKQLVSTERTINIAVGTSKNYIAVFTSEENGVYVSFRANGKIVESGYVGTVTVPENPYVAGYTFLGWYGSDNLKADLTVGAEVNADENTNYYAGFVVDDTAYDVDVNGDVKQYKYNEKVTASADASSGDGKVFAYWTRDGIIVSYANEYSFYVNGNTVLTAVYADEAVSEAVVLTMAAPIKMAEAGKIAFYAERNIPAEYTVIETGIILNQTTDFDIDTAALSAVSKSRDNKGQFTVRKANVSVGDTWYAKAYAIYTDGSEVMVAYSDEVNMTF